MDKTDNELIKSFKGGNSLAFDELVSKYSSKLYQTACAVLDSRQDAEEVVQDVFVRAYRALDKFRGDASLPTWLYRITVNLARNKYHWNRRRGSELNLSLSMPPENDGSAGDLKKEIDISDEAAMPDRMLEKAEAEKGIEAAFRRLPSRLREAMVLRHIEDKSYEEIADLLGCRAGTVKSRIARGRELLRRILQNPDAAVDAGDEYEDNDDEK